MNPPVSGPVVTLRGISKSYPGVRALRDVSFSLHAGEIRALVGENGAGKSTLMRMLTGAESPSTGEIAVDGKVVDRMTPALSEQLGIACVYQNLALAGHLTVAENVWLGRLPGRWGLLQPRQLLRETQRILDHIGYGHVIRPSDRVERLTASQQGMVAIVRALARDARVIIFDEPTAVLAEREVRELFRVIRDLKAAGIAIVYISHRMEEIFGLCDHVTVLKDGAHAGEAAVRDLTEKQLIGMMVGREVSVDHYDASRPKGDILLKAEGVSNAWIHDCAVTLHAGEIVGCYGLVGSGRTELARALFGRDRLHAGRIETTGRCRKLRTPRHAIGAGIGLVPEDRRTQGLALHMSVEHNINLPIYGMQARWGWVNSRQEREMAERFIKELKIRTPSRRQKVLKLSGGNQQKVVLGKWLAGRSRVFLLDEPTNGVDIGAKEEIYRLINRLAREGAAILLISSYMPELMSCCDRIIVMNRGRVAGELGRDEFSEEELLSLAIREMDSKEVSA